MIAGNWKAVWINFLAVGCLTVVEGVAAEDLTGFGVKAGVYFPDSVTVEGERSRDFEADPGLTFGAFLDRPWGSVVRIGPAIDFTGFSAADGDGISKFDFSVDVKLRFPQEDRFELRPGAGVGYGYAIIDKDPVIGFVSEEKNDFFVYKLFLEIRQHRFIGEIGLKGSSGGNEEDVYINDGFYLRAGYLLR